MKFVEKIKKTAKETKKKVKTFWDDNKDIIIFIGATTAGVAATAIGCNTMKKWGEEWGKHTSKESYIPMRLFDSKGNEHHLFKWDSGWQGDPMDDMYFPSCQIGWADEVDWDNL